MTITWSEFPDQGKATIEEILGPEVKKKSQRTELWEPQSGIHEETLTIWERKIMTEFTRSTSSTRIGYPVLMMELKSLKANTLADGLIKKTSSMLDETALQTVHKNK